MSAYYNEHEPYAAEWLRNLIKAGHIADGEVDTRSIIDVAPDDLRGFTQCHFFAGIGGWSLAARLAGWPDDRPLWTGSCPCQPFSVAGQGKGQADERHLWPEYLRLIRAIRPPVVMGEQVAAAVGKSWLDGVCSDLEGVGYATGAVVVPACAVGAPHRRDRLWFVAHSNMPHGKRGWVSCGVHPQHDHADGGSSCRSGDVADAKGGGWGQRVEDARRVPERIGTQGATGRSAQHGDVRPMADADSQRAYTRERNDQAARYGDTADAESISDGVDVADAMRIGRQGPGAVGEPSNSKAGGDGQAGDAVHAGAGFWHTAQWLTGADRKARRFEPSIRLLAHGVPGRVGKLRAYGNAIVPQVAAEIIAAFMECEP